MNIFVIRKSVCTVSPSLPYPHPLCRKGKRFVRRSCGCYTRAVFAVAVLAFLGFVRGMGGYHWWGVRAMVERTAVEGEYKRTSSTVGRLEKRKETNRSFLQTGKSPCIHSRIPIQNPTHILNSIGGVVKIHTLHQRRETLHQINRPDESKSKAKKKQKQKTTTSRPKPQSQK